MVTHARKRSDHALKEDPSLRSFGYSRFLSKTAEPPPLCILLGNTQPVVQCLDLISEIYDLSSELSIGSHDLRRTKLETGLQTQVQTLDQTLSDLGS